MRNCFGETLRALHAAISLESRKVVLVFAAPHLSCGSAPLGQRFARLLGSSPHTHLRNLSS
jgi:hypothetical protein